MSGVIAARLAHLGLTLPQAAAPVANYVPYVRSGSLLYISGQLPLRDGAVAFTGKLGANVDVVAGRNAAAMCMLNLIAQAAAACDGDLDRVERIVRLGGFIACTPDFIQHPQVMNGASDMAVEVFGDKGRHARSTIGVPSLPADACVEVEGLFEIR